MAEVSPVVFEFHARTTKFRSDVRGTTNVVGSDLDRMEARFRANADRISSTMRGLGATLATALTLSRAGRMNGLVNTLAFGEESELPGIPDTLRDLIIALAPPPDGVAARHTVLSADRTERSTCFQLFANPIDRLGRVGSIGHDVLSN